MRNLLLGKRPKDWDLATDAKPDEVLRLFRRTVPTGIRHGTVTVLVGNMSVEVTTLRSDGRYGDGRHPDQVAFTNDIEVDLSRRDFTINGMAMDPLTRAIIDPFFGRKDLAEKVVRAIGDPRERFEEDGLRILRALRFAAELSFAIEERTYSAVKGCAKMLDRISPERVRDEFMRILAVATPSETLLRIRDLGLLPAILPELEDCVGFPQGGPHRFDVYTHLAFSADGARPDKPAVRLAALFHDAGKPRTAATDATGNRTFYRHEEVSAELAETSLKRLRLPNSTVKHVCHLIRHHMFNYASEWSDGAVRRFIARVGRDYFDEVIDLRLADGYGIAARPRGMDDLAELKSRADEIEKQSAALTLKDLSVNGDDLITQLGVRPGPDVGRILAFLLETVLDDPAQNSPERLLGMAKRFIEHRLTG